MSINRLFLIGKSSLMSNQRALNITSKNISNVNTDGYTRQRVDINEITNEVVGMGRLGSGISADVVRVEQRLVQYQLWREKTAYARFESDERILQQIESVFAEGTDTGIADVLGEFWGAWNDLANDPESSAARTIVRDKGNLLATTFNRTHTNLTSMQEQLNDDIVATVDRINREVAKIAQLNQQIIQNDNADLLDERERLINNLSEKLNIEVRHKDDNTVTVSTDGLILVSGTETNRLTTEVSRDDGIYTTAVRFADFPQQPGFSGGELASLLETQNERIPRYFDRLNALARSVAEQVNGVHRTGENLDGVGGLNFFDEPLRGAADFKVSKAIDATPSLIATRSPGSGVGGNDIAGAIFNLQFDEILNGETANDFYTGMVTELGSTLDEAAFLEDSQGQIVQQLENQRDSISGVSLDEEMTRLIQFEQAYQAASKVINTVDEMMETLLSIV